MTDPRKAKFGPYVRRLADLMGLRDWTVTILQDAPDSNHQASAEARYGRKVINIRFAESFLDDDEEEQRAACVHELIHAHTAATNIFLEKQLAQGRADDSAWQAYHLLMEYMVDGIAEEWAKSLPLPSEVKARRSR